MSGLRPHILIFLLLVGDSLSAEAGFPFLSETVSWDEDVLQTDGQVLSVHRTATYREDAYGRSGRGRLTEQTIRFSHNGQRIRWTNNDLWPIVYMPEILDIVNDMPVLVMPVVRWGPCEKYGFPQEGLVAFGYRKGRWDRIALSDLPKELRVNLLRSTHAIRYWDQYKGKRITPSDKKDLERSGWGATKQDQSISEASKFYSGIDIDDSCARMRPLPNPGLDALKKKNADAEREAQTIVATFTTSSTAPEKISADSFSKAKGQWTGFGYLAAACKGVVERVEGIREYRDGGAWHLIGYTLVLTTGNLVPIEQLNLTFFQAPTALESIACDERQIYTLKRLSREQLLLHRFLHTGSLIDAVRIILPGLPEGKWLELWEVVPANAGLHISLGSYSYTGTANQGGILEQRLDYTTQLEK